MVVGDFVKHTECLVIGSGPGGYVAAIRASQLGKHVTLVEKDFIGGTCLNVGCIPSKALIHATKDMEGAMRLNKFGVKFEPTSLDFRHVQMWKDNDIVRPLTDGIKALLKKNNVECVMGETHFVDNHKVRIMQEEGWQTIQFEWCVIASGSRPIEIPGFKRGKRVLDSTGALNLRDLPDSIALIGGGYIGCELANIFSSLNVNVTLLEASPQLLPNFSSDLVEHVVESFEKKGVDVKTSVDALNAHETDQGVVITYREHDLEKILEVDVVIVTVGRRPNTDDIGLEYTDISVDDKGLITVDDQGRTAVNHIFAIGDVTKGLQLAHKASYEAKVVAGVINGYHEGFDAIAIPSVVYTTPEIACVGIALKDALKTGVHAQAVQFPYQANGRALTLENKKGFIRIIFETENRTIIGAEIVGEHASEMIAELTIAIETFLTLDDLAQIIHAHPTLSEMIGDVAELGLGIPIHI